jgi:hypothetical protein
LAASAEETGASETATTAAVTIAAARGRVITQGP